MDKKLVRSTSDKFLAGVCGGLAKYFGIDATPVSDTHLDVYKRQTIGTANLDRLSLMGNYEINIEITDADVAAEMESIFAMDAGNCCLLYTSRCV